MRYELFKIIDPAFAQSLLEGNLYMNPLSFFRTLEEGGENKDNKAQKDPMEGICGSIPKDRLRQFGFHFSKEILDAMDGRVTLLSENYGYNNLFCLYRLKIDEESRIIQRPSSRLTNFNDEGSEPKVVIRFKKPEEFLRRLEAAIQRALKEQNLEYAIYGGVVYGNDWENADDPGTCSAFHKDPSYGYQEEWRLCILRREWEEKAISFPIGYLEDICEVLPLDQFLDHLDQVYPGYTLVENLEGKEPETYRTFSKINTVSRLMYAYMPQMPHKPTRSDEAEADWHYAQYLMLKGRQQEVAPYLEKQLHCCKDLDHMELLAQHCLSQRQWVKATDAFAYLLHHAPEQIRQAPGRFFFQLHSILMQHQEPADAAKLMEIAVSQYEIPKEMENIMKSDCLLALGFYDQAEVLFKAILKEMPDPILEYDLAVCSLYLLHFEEAAEHLRTFKRYFSQSHRVAHQADSLDRLVECFRTRTPLKEVSGDDPFRGLTWTKQTEETLQQARTSGVGICLGVEALYQLEIAQKWGLAAELISIMVTPMTIWRLVELYQNTGLPVFFQIIEHLAGMEQLVIRSPDLKYYLAMGLEYPDWPPHCKMEQALLVQETTKTPQTASQS